MKLLPKEYLDLAEGVIKRYPIYKKEHKEWEQAIVAWCHQLYLAETKNSTNEVTSEPERIIEAKEKNRRYQLLSNFVGAVEAALKKLSKDEFEIIELSCWEGVETKDLARLFNFHERNIRRIKARAFRKMVPLLISAKALQLELAS